MSKWKPESLSLSHSLIDSLRAALSAAEADRCTGPDCGKPSIEGGRLKEARAVIAAVRGWKDGAFEFAVCHNVGVDWHAIADKIDAILPTDSAEGDLALGEPDVWECSRCGVVNHGDSDWCETCNEDHASADPTSEGDGE